MSLLLDLPSPPKIRRLRFQHKKRSTPALILWLILISVSTVLSTWVLLQNVITGGSNHEQTTRKLESKRLKQRTAIQSGQNKENSISSFDDLQIRDQCRQYGFSQHESKRKKTGTNTPRVFFGSVIKEDSWEQVKEMAFEVYGLFSGMVFVLEQNATMFHEPDAVSVLQELMGSPRIRVLQSVSNKNDNLQRQELISAWNEMGMKPGDIGLLGNVGDCSINGFLQALNICGGLDSFGYNNLEASSKCTTPYSEPENYLNIS